MSLYSAAQFLLQHSGISSILSFLLNETPAPLPPMDPEFEAQKKVLAGLLDILPSELHRVILSHCDLRTLLACCLTTRRILDDSRARLYHRIHLRDANVLTFIHGGSRHVHLVRHLRVTVCPVIVGAPWAGYYHSHVKGMHDESWLWLIDELKQANKLESFALTSPLETTSLMTPTLESAFFQLKTIESLKEVKADLVLSPHAIQPRCLDWGPLLKGVRVCSSIGGFGVPGEAINLMKSPSTTQCIDIPVLEYLEVERLANPGSALQQYFDIHHVRCLSLCLKGWNPKDGRLLEDVLASVAPSLEVLSIGWIQLDRELEDLLIKSQISLVRLHTLNLLVNVDQNAEVLSSRVLPCLESIFQRSPKLRHLQIMFTSSFHNQFDEHLSNSLIVWTAFGSFISKQPNLITLKVWFSQMGPREDVDVERTLTRKRLIDDIFGRFGSEGRLFVRWNEKGIFWPFFN
ncbi:hypothetical protein DL96DRAFT_1820665 [Flagelloscypha sp. PMI_526]|nr:hypothetical protein DL96DRAFT_1820665 [Flagelloscypha sp. PMI_526]